MRRILYNKIVVGPWCTKHARGWVWRKKCGGSALNRAAKSGTMCGALHTHIAALIIRIGRRDKALHSGAKKEHHSPYCERGGFRSHGRSLRCFCTRNETLLNLYGIERKRGGLRRDDCANLRSLGTMCKKGCARNRSLQLGLLWAHVSFVIY
jgi:hypothetical protein